jgi:hypothetical protein
MALAPNRALLLQLEAFVAENNIRRSVLLCGTNSRSADSSFSDRSGVLSAFPGAGASVNFPCITINKMTVVKVGSPVLLDLVLSSGGPTITITCDPLTVLSTQVYSLIIRNTDILKSPPYRIIQI